MNSYRTFSRAIPITAHRPLRVRQQSIRKMSFFPRAFISHEPSYSFTPLFRLLDDFHEYSSSSGGRKTLNPRFDARELESAYELHGELPGVDQKNIEIEFNDTQTITIRGRLERTYSSGTPPAGFVEGGKIGGAITQGGESNNFHKASVEDEEDNEKGKIGGPTGEEQKQERKDEQQQDKRGKLWVSERSVGEFVRSFNFPSRVDHNNVKAHMKDGILTIVIPKIKKQESRKITIS